MLQLMIRPLLVNATCHWLYMTEVELGDCKIKLLCMHVLAQCQQSMSILIERISGARELCPLEELKSAFRESHQLCWPVRGLLLDICQILYGKRFCAARGSTRQPDSVYQVTA